MKPQLLRINLKGYATCKILQGGQNQHSIQLFQVGPKSTWYGCSLCILAKRETPKHFYTTSRKIDLYFMKDEKQQQQKKENINK